MLQITIGAAPHGGLSLANDIRLVKAVLLYADKARLVSPGAFLIHSIASARHLGDAETFAAFLPSMLVLEPSLGANSEALSAAALLLGSTRAQRRRLPTKLRKEMEGHIKAVRSSLQQLRDRVVLIGEQSGLGELERALSSGIVALHEFATPNESLDTTIEEFTATLFDVVESGSAYPLFDEQVHSLVRAAIDEGMISTADASLDRGRQIQLAAYLFGRLPLFDAAPVDEILDIRRMLERPLIRFRAAIAEFSAAVKSAPWDSAFEHDAEKIFVTKVQPAVLEIEDAVRMDSYLAKLTDRLTADQIASGSLVAFLTNQVAASAAVAAAAGAAMVGSLAALRALRDHQKSTIQVQKNHLFFYYEARRLLK